MKKYCLIAILSILAISAFGQTSTAPINFYSTTVDALSRTVTFNIGYTSAQNFGVDDGTGYPVDSFQLWIDPDAPSALDRAQLNVVGALAGSKQTIISMNSYLTTGMLQAVTVQAPDYVGPRTSDGWGADAGSFALGIGADHAAHLTVPFSVLQSSNGHCYYSLMILHDGAMMGERVFEGATGIFYTAPFPTAVPETSTWALALAGFACVVWLRRRRSGA